MSKTVTAIVLSLTMLFYAASVNAGQSWNRTKESFKTGSDNLAMNSKQAWQDTRQITTNFWQDTRDFSVDLWNTTKESVQKTTDPINNTIH